MTPTPNTHTDHNSIDDKNSSWWNIKSLLKGDALSEIPEQRAGWNVLNVMPDRVKQFQFNHQLNTQFILK